MTHHITKLVEQARTRPMTAEEREEQRIGFAFGNAPRDDRNTKETIREIAKAQRGIGQTETI